jgi:septal ring-binding cell division protein DamX
VVASVSPNAAKGAAHDTRNSSVSAWIGNMFMVARNLTHASDGGSASQRDHCLNTETAVTRAAVISNPPEANHPVSADVARRRALAGSMVMLLPEDEWCCPSE